MCVYVWVCVFVLWHAENNGMTFIFQILLNYFWKLKKILS